MSYIRDAIHNQVLISAALSWLIAQVLKVLIDGIRNGFSAERLAGGGGMPSSHSATVAGLTTATVLVYGCGGFEFVMALFFAIIVIYDAAGVRMETGREAKVLNLLRRGIWKRGESLSTTGISRRRWGTRCRRFWLELSLAWPAAPSSAT